MALFTTIYLKTFWQAGVKLVYDGGLSNASNIALSLLLSLFPFLMLIAALVRLWGDPALAKEVVDLVLGHWPAGSSEAILRQVNVILAQSSGEFFSLSTLIALVIATNGVESARDGLNRAYRIVESRSFIRRRLQGAVFVLAGALGLIGTAFILVGTPLVWQFLLNRLNWLEQFVFLVTLAQYGMAILVLGVTLFAFHRFFPDGRRPLLEIIWGILVTIAGILVGSKLFAIYLQNIANYTALYAGLAGTMIAIVYLYCFSILILYGAEFNAALVEPEADNTIGNLDDGHEQNTGQDST